MGLVRRSRVLIARRRRCAIISPNTSWPCTEMLTSLVVSFAFGVTVVATTEAILAGCFGRQAVDVQPLGNLVPKTVLLSAVRQTTVRIFT